MSDSAKTKKSLASTPLLYFVFALGWSWAFWVLDIALGLSTETPSGNVLALIGLLGPAVAAISGWV